MGGLLPCEIKMDELNNTNNQQQLNLVTFCYNHTYGHLQVVFVLTQLGLRLSFCYIFHLFYPYNWVFPTIMSMSQLSTILSQCQNMLL